MEFFKGFSWALPTAFSDAISACRFVDGDMLYDTRKAYQQNWDLAKEHVLYSLQVMGPDGSQSAGAAGKGSIFKKNWNSEVRLDLYRNHEKVNVGQTHTTQGRLFTALWRGDLTVLDESTEAPALPILVGDVTRQLRDARAAAIKIAKAGPVFVMARDRTNFTSRLKYRKILAKVRKYMDDDVVLRTPKSTGLVDHDRMLPTIDILFFPTVNLKHDELHDLVKSAVYAPAKDAKTDKFNILKHGVIFE